MNRAQEFAALAVRIATEAALLIGDRKAAGVTVAATKTSEVDVVTEADRAAESRIRELVREARPDDALFGEEEDAESGTSGVRWIIDPIDGTVNFLYGIPEYAVSIAVEVDGEVVAGTVVNAATGLVYSAAKDDDGNVRATRDGVPLPRRTPTGLATALVATGFSYDHELRRRQAQALVGLLPRVRDIRRLGSCALDLCRVADGSVDAYVEEGVNLWDYAAGALIAAGAGVRVQTGIGIGGRTLIVAAPDEMFATFDAAIRTAGYAAGGQSDTAE